MTDVIPGQRCNQDNCPSKKYRVEDGEYICVRCGTVNTALRQSFAEDDEMRLTGHVAKTRREPVEDARKILKGSAARVLFLEAYQVILLRQCSVVRSEKQLPKEVEEVIRGLWALRMQLLNVEDSISYADTLTQHSSLALDRKRREGSQKRKQRTGKANGEGLPTLVQTLGLLYLATSVLRLPISLGDIYRWAMREEIPFIRAVRHIPLEVRSQLPATFLKALDTQTILRPDYLRRTCHQLTHLYRHHFKLKIPSLNWPLFLFKYVKELALPVNVYLAVRELIGILDIRFKFSESNEWLKVQNFPEVRLMSLLIVVVKLYHPFDTSPCYVSSIDDSAAVAMDWEIWAKFHRGHQDCPIQPQILPTGDEIKITDRDVSRLSSQQLDQYLDWYGKTWLTDDYHREKKGKLPSQLLEMFPIASEILPDSTTSPDTAVTSMLGIGLIEDRIKNVQRGLRIRATISGTQGYRGAVRSGVGELYKRFPTINELTPAATTFFAAAADTVGISLASLLSAVMYMESLIERWRRDRTEEDTDRSSDHKTSQSI